MNRQATLWVMKTLLDPRCDSARKMTASNAVLSFPILPES